MAPSTDDDVLARVRDVRSVENITEDARESLEELRNVLLSHQTDNAQNATHVVLENYPDWWCTSRRAPAGLHFNQGGEGGATQEDLCRAVGTLHTMGIPMTLAEKRTPVFRLFQDVEAWGTRDASIPMEDLVDPECELMLLLGRVMGEIFPGHGGFLDAVVFDSTGLSQTKGVKKTSLRLVWPSLAVDSDRAPRVRDLVVHRVTGAAAEEGGAIAKLGAKLREFSEKTAWHTVFGDAAYAARACVRMPFCDRVSPLPLRAPERRPLTAIGVLRFTFNGNGGNLKQAEWLCREDELDAAEWVKIGSVRMSSDTKLTEWSMPSFATAQPIPPSSTRTGRVKVRTAGGSEAIVGGMTRTTAQPVKPPSSERAGQLLTVERRFNGPPENFCEKIEPHLGQPIAEADDSLVWRQTGGEARVVLYGEDRRVKVIGKPSQVRSLVVMISPWTEAVQSLGAALCTRVPQENRAPSAAYAPSENTSNGNVAESTGGEPQAGSAEVSDASVTQNSTAAVPDPATPAAGSGQTRVTHQAFDAQGQGELPLRVGDVVVVSHDPEGDTPSVGDRWVYGDCQASGQCGWFPLSHTSSLKACTFQNDVPTMSQQADDFHDLVA
eukprot:TRINITY_DN45910_c0_g1_i1.p1 TRINITY_DN45910_c0_g1~~TRINITY_DN45910_c0_g1_i1.p1  ORF type:complete len:608 (-),score=80.96 TRINITY_DN45910_c0_g1_i1:44-1867(-)